MQPSRKPLDRHARVAIQTALSDTPVVVLQGARQVGKSTLAGEISRGLGGTFVTLDDEVTRLVSQDDPTAFVLRGGSGLLVIDEIQRSPGLMLAIKATVDRDRRPGRFLVTGSADLLRLRSVEDSLAGRAETVELFGLSQGELIGTRETFIDDVFTDGPPVEWASKLTRADYLERACAGGFPEALRRNDRRRDSWFADYAQRVLARDAAEISEGQRLGDLPRLLRFVASRSATELNQADLARDSAFAARTLPSYLDLLEMLYLIWRIPAWSSNLTNRLVKRPKIALTDSGLLAHLLNLSPAGMDLLRDPTPAGPLIETFVVNELRRQAGWSAEAVRIFHLREGDRLEVDIILEHRDGRVAGIEVKAGASLGAKAFKGLAELRDRLGSRFARGIVLYSGSDALPAGDRLAALPIEALWRGRGAA